MKDHKQIKHRPFKPTKADLDERRQHHPGKRLDWPKGQEPLFEPKTVTTKACVICGIVFMRHEAICNSCGNCQACGGLNTDRYGNVCHQCGNEVDQPRFDTLGPMIHIGV